MYLDLSSHLPHMFGMISKVPWSLNQGLQLAAWYPAAAAAGHQLVTERQSDADDLFILPVYLSAQDDVLLMATEQGNLDLMKRCLDVDHLSIRTTNQVSAD